MKTFDKLEKKDTRKIINDVLREYQSRFEHEINCLAPKTKIVFEKTSYESFAYCDWCSCDLYDKGFDDDMIKEIEYCPYCGAEIIRNNLG
jgi:hypothetical protein